MRADLHVHAAGLTDEASAVPERGEIEVLRRALERTRRRLERERAARREAETIAERTTRDLYASNERLRQSNADLEQFAYAASHDLQEPLRMVATYVDTIREHFADREDERLQRYLMYAIEGAGRMQHLIEDLLVYSRVDRMGSTMRPTPLDRPLDTALKNLELAIHETGATFHRDPLPVLSVDETQIVQLFQNLVGNAIKFRRPDDTPHIEIRANRNGPEWTLQVSDRGIGFEPEYADRVFGIFKRLNPRSTYPGTGLGLALCKKIVERHGGRIRADARPDEGTTITLTLPSVRSEGRSGAAHLAPQEAP